MIPRTPCGKFRTETLLQASAASAKPSPGTKDAVMAARQKKMKDVENAYLDSLRRARLEYFDERKSVSEPTILEIAKPDLAAKELLEIDTFAAGASSSDGTSPASDLNLSAEMNMSARMLANIARPGTASVAGRLDSADFDREVDRLMGRMMEVESVLRLPFETPEHVREAMEALEASRLFVIDLGELSEKLCVLKGQAFQEMLARGGGRRQGGQLGRERLTGLVKLEDALASEDEIMRTVARAEGMCDLVRVKIEDDNDLGLANMVLEDCRTFFDELGTCAASKRLGVAALFFQLRALDAA